MRQYKGWAGGGGGGGGHDMFSWLVWDATVSVFF